MGGYVADIDKSYRTVTIARENINSGAEVLKRGPESSEFNTMLESLIEPAAEKTPVASQIEDTSSPQTEDIHRGNLPASAESHDLSPPPKSCVMDVPPVQKLITEAARTLYQLSQHQDGVLRGVHRRILQSL